MKKAKRAKFLKQYWNVQQGSHQLKKEQIVLSQTGKTINDVAKAIGEDPKTIQRLLNLNELIPELQEMVSSGALGQNAAAQKNIRRCIMRIAVDVGYSSVKGLSEHGRVMFPSVAAPMAEDLLAGAIHCGALQHSVRIHRDLNNIEEHLVGDAALMSTSATGFLAQREKPNGIHDLLLLTAAYLLASGHEDCLDVAIGLPISYFKTQRAELKARLEKLSTWLSVDGGAERCLHFARVSVIPQGAGALMTAGQLPASGLISLLDIGSYTTDYLVFDVRQGQPVPVSECCGSVEAGVSLVTMALAAEFLRQTGAPLPARMHEATLAKVLAGEPQVYQGKPVDLRKALTAAREQVGTLIASSVAASLRDRVGFVQQMLLAGGGALLFEQEIARVLTCVRVIDDPVFANAKGFLSMSADSS